MDQTQAMQAIQALVTIFLTMFVSPLAITEFLQSLASKIGATLPPVAKQILAFVVTSGLVGSGVAHLPAIGVLGTAGTQALTGLMMWFISMVEHDSVLAPSQPAKPVTPPKP